MGDLHLRADGLTSRHDSLPWVRGARVLGPLVALVVAMTLASCAPVGTAPTGATAMATSGQVTPALATTTTTPAVSVLGTPSPAPGTLGAPPTNCAFADPPATLTVAQLGPNANAHLVGGGNFWIFGIYYQRVLHLGQLGTPRWPIAKMVVEVGPNYALPVTLTLRDTRTGALAWWTDGSGPPGAATQRLILDPQSDTESVGQQPGVPAVPHGAVSSAWREWGVFPLFTEAGCYALEVRWAGGSWQSVFAAGR